MRVFNLIMIKLKIVYTIFENPLFNSINLIYFIVNFYSNDAVLLYAQN